MRFICGMILLFAGVCHGLAVHAQDVAIEFEHSPNAKQAQDKHHDAMGTLLLSYQAAMKKAGDHFARTADRHVKRYITLLEREVRSLTRAGDLDAATEASSTVEASAKWDITAPDEEGVHFLNQVDLQVTGSDKATKLGVDLLVDVEKAGVLFTKQADAALENYTKQVLTQRKALIAALDRVKSTEQSAGRLQAVKEVMDAIDQVKALPAPKRPGVSSQNTRRVEHDGQPSYAGYYLIDYKDHSLFYDKFMIELDENGGTAHFVKKPADAKMIYIVRRPFEIVERDKRSMKIRHELQEGAGYMVHTIALKDGQPSSSNLWWKEADFESGAKPVGPGTVKKISIPAKDLRGWDEGFYRAKIRHTIDSKGNACDMTAGFEF